MVVRGKKQQHFRKIFRHFVFISYIIWTIKLMQKYTINLTIIINATIGIKQITPFTNRHPRPKLDTIYNIKTVWCICFKGLYLVILSLRGIRAVCLISFNKFYWNIIEKLSMLFTFKMFLQMFLYALFFSFKTFTFRLVIILSATKVVRSLTSVLFFTFVTSRQVHKTFVITV